MQRSHRSHRLPARFAFHTGTLVAVSLVCLCLPIRLAKAQSTSLRTGRALQEELAEPVPSVSWQNVPFRDALRRLADEHRIAVLLDRRIDPSRLVDTSLVNETVLGVVESLAEDAGGDVKTVGDVVYVGPEKAAARLRTLVRLRSEELFALRRNRPRGGRATGPPTKTIRWNDLDTPRDVLNGIAEAYDVEITGLDRVPHDLWAGATLPRVSLAEALSLVLVQFDLTFAWSDDGRALRLVPVPEQVGITKSYARPSTAAEDAQNWPRLVPGLKTERKGSTVVATGTVEQLETLDALLAGRTPSRPARTTEAAPLSRRRFTLTVRNAPVSAVMKRLAESGIRFRYDARRLAAKKIDLDTKVDLKLDDGTADELFRQMFGPLGLAFEVDGVTVRLSPE